jgi:O-antigen/teichoic acid export membrane protein
MSRDGIRPATLSIVSLTRKVAVNATALAAGRGLLAVTGLVSVALATRYLGLHAYGALVAAIAFVTAFSPVADIGLSSIAAREMAKRPGEEERLVGVVFMLSLVLTGVSSLALVTASQFVYRGAENADLRSAILLLAVTGLPAGAAAVAAGSYFVARQQAWVGVIAGVAASLVTVSLLALAVALGWGFTGIVVAYAATAAAYGTTMVLFARGRIRLRPKFDRVLGRQLLVWALPLGLLMMLQAIYWRADTFLLSILSSNAQVGLFGLAFKVVDTTLVLPFYITITLLPEFSRLSEMRARLDLLVERALRLMLFVVIPMFTALFVFADEIVELAGGRSFDGAATVLRILLVGVSTAFLSTVIGQALIAVNRQSRLLYVGVLILVVNVSIAAVLIPLLGARGAAIAFSCSEVCALPLLLAMYKQERRLPRLVPPLGLVAAAAVMLIVALVKFPLQSLSGNAGVVLVVGGGIAMCAYVAALYAFKTMPTEIHEGLVTPLLGRLHALPRRWRRPETVSGA